MNIVIFGGSGFIGQKLAEELVARGHTVSSVSRHGKPSALTASWSHEVIWLKSDILEDTKWQPAVAEADWVVDAIGILFESSAKGVTYDRFIFEPVRLLTTYLQTQKKPAKFLFISANAAPFLLNKYFRTKKQAEQLIQTSIKDYQIVYPTLVIDQIRPLTFFLGHCLLFFSRLPGFKQLIQPYRPVIRQQLAQEIANVMEGKPSIYTQRQ